MENAGIAISDSAIIIYIPIIIVLSLGLVNLITVYGLIPFYIIGGFAIWMTMSTIIFMSIALIMSVLGYLILLESSVFSIAYILKSGKDKVHGIGWCLLGMAAQFFFMADVIALAILGLKEKRFVRTNIVLLIRPTFYH